MIVFEVIQNDRAGTIVHKLAALIKESRVIFIGFDHEKLRLGQASRMSEILRNTADQKTRIQSAVFQNPSQHRAGCGFSVRPGNGKHVTAVQNILLQPLWSGAVRQSAVENFLEQRIASTNCIADDI